MSPAACAFGATVLHSSWRPAVTARPSWIAAAMLEHYRRLAMRRRVQIDKAVNAALKTRQP